MRVAIVGSGVSGLSALWCLKKHSEHEVNIYESASTAGGQVRGISYDREGKTPCIVDTGLMAFSPTGSPTLAAFLKLLNVPTRRTDMTLGVTRDGRRISPAPSGLLNPSAWRLSFDILRFQYCADAGDDVSLGEYLVRERYSPQLFNDFLLPQIAELWLVADDLTALSMPAGAVIRGLRSHSQSQWMAIKGGGNTLVETLSSAIPPENLHLNAEIVSITSHDYGVRLVEAGGAHHIYDHVILAIPSKRALKLIKAGGWASEEEQSVLDGAEWTGLDAVPELGATDAAIRYISIPAPPAYDSSVPNRSQQISLTYDMGKIQDLSGVKLNVSSTGNVQYEVPHRPVGTPDAAEIQNTRRVSYIGAWTGSAGGRVEDALTSALSLVSAPPFSAAAPIAPMTPARRRGVVATLARIVLAYAESVRSVLAPWWAVLSWPVALALALLEAVTRPFPTGIHREVAQLRKCWE